MGSLTIFVTSCNSSEEKVGDDPSPSDSSDDEEASDIRGSCMTRAGGGTGMGDGDAYVTSDVVGELFFHRRVIWMDMTITHRVPKRIENSIPRSHDILCSDGV